MAALYLIGLFYIFSCTRIGARKLFQLLLCRHLLNMKLFVESPDCFPCGCLSFVKEQEPIMCRVAMQSHLTGTLCCRSVAPVDLFVIRGPCVTALNFKWPGGKGKSAFGPLLISALALMPGILPDVQRSLFPPFPTFSRWQHPHPHIS